MVSSYFVNQQLGYTTDIMDDIYNVFKTFSWDLIPENVKMVCAKPFKVLKYLRMKVKGSALLLNLAS